MDFSHRYKSFKNETVYAAFSNTFMNKDTFEQTIIEHMVSELDWKHLYGPDVERTSADYNDVFLPAVFEESIRRINENLPEPAITEALLKVKNIDAASLEDRNEILGLRRMVRLKGLAFHGQVPKDNLSLQQQVQRQKMPDILCY